MQVSWIEPEEIRALVERLQDARPKARPLGWELHTLPDAPPGVIEDHSVEVQALWSHVAAEQPPPEPAQPPSLPAAEPVMEHHTGQPELDRIRQKLRALRSKAEEAGLLRGVPEMEPHDAVEEAPSDLAPSPDVNRTGEEAPAVAEIPASELPNPPVEARVVEPEAQREKSAPETVTLYVREDESEKEQPSTLAAVEEIFPTESPKAAPATDTPHIEDAPASPRGLSETAVVEAFQSAELAMPAGAHDALEKTDAKEVTPPALPEEIIAPEPPIAAPQAVVSAGASEEIAPPTEEEKPAAIAADTSPAVSDIPAPPPVPEPAVAPAPSPFRLADFVATATPVSPPVAVATSAPEVPQSVSVEPAPTGRAISPPVPSAPAPVVAPAMPLAAVVLPGGSAAPPRMVIEVPPPMPRDAELSFEIPLGNMPERLQAFAGWAMRRTRTTEFLIVDAHGDVLWGRHVHAGLVVSTMLACTAALRSSAIGAAELLGVIEQPLPAEKILSVIPCQTCYGVINIAVVRREGVEEPEAALLRRALVAAIEARPPGEGAEPVGSAID